MKEAQMEVRVILEKMLYHTILKHLRLLLIIRTERCTQIL
nr:MAG TPA: hypothetical protein [Caudoviricetes sp.]